jgi:uncharacterized protein YbcI
MLDVDLTPETGPVRDGAASPALQISNALGRLHKELAGRGPTKVRTHIDEDLIVCVLEGGLTRAERTVRDHAGGTAVVEIRHRLQSAMRAGIREAVEEILGRRVESFMSANDPDRDLQVEVMLLEPRTLRMTAHSSGSSALAGE